MFCRARPYVLLALLGLLFFGDLVLHPSRVLYSDHSDMLAMHLPMKRFLVRSWQQTGELPLWNPYSFGGMPFIHDVQVAAFYPLHLPLYLLPEEYVGAGMSWLVVVHVILAGWLMYAYARYRGLGLAAALVAGVGFMFAGKWLLHVLAGGHYIMIPLAWLPLVLLFLEQAIARRSLLRATGAGAVFTMIILGTHPQMTLYAGVFIALWTFGSMLVWSEVDIPDGSNEPSKRLRWRALLWFLGLGAWTVLAAAALSAVQLLPALEAAREASRSAGVSARDIVAVCLPSVMGLIGPGWSGAWEDRGGFGVLWLAAAITAPLLFRGRVRFEGAICFILLLFSIGGAVLVQWLPGFRLFQIPVRMLMLLALPVALLAGRTTQALLDEFKSAGKASALCRGVLVRVLVVGVMLGIGSALEAFITWRKQHAGQAANTFGHDFFYSFVSWTISVPADAWSYWLKLSVVAALATWLLANRSSVGRFRWKWAWGLLLLAELWALALPRVASRPETSIYLPSECVRTLAEAKRKQPHEPWRVLDRGLPDLPSSSPLGPALPMLGNIQLEPVLGYNSFDVQRYKEYLQFVLDKDEPIAPRSRPFGYPILDIFPIRNKSFLDLLGTRFLLQPSRPEVKLNAPGEPARNSSWRLIDWDPQPAAYSFLQGGVQNLPVYTVFENQGAFPRAFLVHRAKPLADRAHVLEQMKATDLRREVLLEQDGAYGDGDQANADATDSVTIREYLPNRVTLEIKTNHPAFLVLTDVWFPGWICTADGAQTPVLRADFLFRAVALPAGNHEVVFRFDPASFRLGRMISILAVCFVAVLCLSGLAIGWMRRRAPQRALF